MIDHAQRTARLEHREERREGRRLRAAHHHVMDVAEGQDGVHAVGGDRGAFVGEGDNRDLVIDGRLGGQEGLVTVQIPPGRLQGIEFALIVQQRRQYLSVPATAGRIFDHCLGRRHAEKGERFGRVAIFVARDIGRRAAGRRDGGGDRVSRLGRVMIAMPGMLGEQGQGRQGKAGQQQSGTGETVHRQSSLEKSGGGCAGRGEAMQGGWRGNPRQPRFVMKQLCRFSQPALTGRLPGKADRNRTSAPCPACRDAGPSTDIRRRSFRCHPHHDIRT